MIILFLETPKLLSLHAIIPARRMLNASVSINTSNAFIFAFCLSLHRLEESLKGNFFA
jgi:hypothetical protein